jgi:hypothetical protein
VMFVVMLRLAPFFNGIYRRFLGEESGVPGRSSLIRSSLTDMCLSQTFFCSLCKY